MKPKPKPLTLGILCLLNAAVFATLHFAFPRENVKDAGDLSVVSGHLKSYLFWKGTGSRDYVIRLSEYPVGFQIPGNCIMDFSKVTFEANLHTGDVLWVSIPKLSENTLTSRKRVSIFSVRTKTATYLDEKDAIPSRRPCGFLLYFSWAEWRLSFRGA